MALIPLETGCRDSGDRFKLPVVPASGTLTIPGMETADLALSFIPDDQKLTNAWSIVGADGIFRVSTYEPGDGIAVGTYTVIISGGVGVMPDDDNRLGKIPPQYRNAGNSPWKIEIAPDPDRNVLNLVTK